MQVYFENYLNCHLDVVKHILNDKYLMNQIELGTKTILKSLQNKNKIIFAGNGGSAAEAQHMSAELVGKLNFDRETLPGVSLTTDTSAITAISNDYGFSKIFSRQLLSIGKKGDVLIVYSTSGKSLNILNAITCAKKNNISVIGFAGEKGFNNVSCDVEIKVKSQKTSLIQETHNVIGHMIFSYVEEKVFIS